MNDLLKAALVEKARRERARRQSGQVVEQLGEGRVVRGAGGELSYTSPGYSTNDPAKIEQLMKGATPAQTMQSDLDEERIAANPVAARGLEAVQGVPFVGEFTDEVVGVVSPEAAQNMRLTSDAMERSRPGQSAALGFAGGVAGALPLAAVGAGAGAANWVGKGGSLGGKTMRAMAVGAGAGAAEGVATGAGRGEGMEGRATEAAKFGALGVALGGVIGGGTPAVAKTIRESVMRIKGLDVSVIADEFGISKSAARMVKSALANDDLDAAARHLGNLGDDAMLADAGPGAGALLDAAAQTGGHALKVTREAVEGRAAQAGTRLNKALDTILGAPQGVKTTARGIAQKTAAGRKAAYDAAFASPIDYAAPTGRAIEDTLSKIPPRTLQAAVDEANEAMQAAGVKNMQILADIADDGSVIFREMPNVQQLDQLKQALGQVARNEVDQFGRPTAKGLRAKRLAGELRDAITEATGGGAGTYARALKLGGDKLQQDEALDLGRKLLKRGTTLEDVKGFVKSGGVRDARDALYQGVREGIEETLSNVRRTITDPNTDAREAMALVKDLSSRANQSKLQAILGPGRTQALMREIEKSTAALELRAATSRNSATAIRQSIQEQSAMEVQPGALKSVLGNSGNPLELAQGLTQRLVGIDPATLSGQQKALLDEVAEILVNTKGAAAVQSLRAVKRAMQGQPLKEAEAKMISHVVTTGLASGGHQSAMPLIGSQLSQ